MSCPARRCICPDAPLPLTISLARRIAEEFEGGAAHLLLGRCRRPQRRGALRRGHLAPLPWPPPFSQARWLPAPQPDGQTLMDCGSEPFRGVNAQAVAALAEQVSRTPITASPSSPCRAEDAQKGAPHRLLLSAMPGWLPHRTGYPRLPDGCEPGSTGRRWRSSPAGMRSPSSPAPSAPTAVPTSACAITMRSRSGSGR